MWIWGVKSQPFLIEIILTLIPPSEICRNVMRIILGSGLKKMVGKAPVAEFIQFLLQMCMRHDLQPADCVLGLLWKGWPIMPMWSGCLMKMHTSRMDLSAEVIHFTNKRKDAASISGKQLLNLACEISKRASLWPKQGFEPRSLEMKAPGINHLQCLTRSFVFNKML